MSLHIDERVVGVCSKTKHSVFLLYLQTHSRILDCRYTRVCFVLLQARNTRSII